MKSHTYIKSIALCEVIPGNCAHCKFHHKSYYYEEDSCIVNGMDLLKLIGNKEVCPLIPVTNEQVKQLEGIAEVLTGRT